MSKRLVLTISILLIIAAYIFNVDRVIRNNLSTFQTYTTNIYLDTVVFLSTNFNKYFNQLTYIEQLKKENEELQKYKTEFEVVKSEIFELKRLNGMSFKNELNLEKVRVISYNNFLDKSIVSLYSKALSDNNITGLITYDGYSAGIVFNKDNETIAYLNENKKCNYAVFIGSDNAPGITAGKTVEGDLIIDHIPLWKKAKEGDPIITSGMDSIYPHGIKVGEVIKVEKLDNTQRVFAKVYAESLGNRDYYLFLK